MKALQIPCDGKYFTDQIIRNADREEIEKSYFRDLGKRLYFFRMKQHLTQQRMIDELQPTSPQTTSAYSKWESGTASPSIAFLVQLHERWGVDLNELLAGDVPARSPLPHEVRAAIFTLQDYLKLSEK